MRKESVVITGGTKGIGYAAAKAFSESGDVAEILLCYHSDESYALEAVSKLRDKYTDVTYHLLRLDISKKESPQQFIDSIDEMRLLPTVVCFNANITDRTPLEELNNDTWLQLFQANVHFPVAVIQKLLSRMMRSGLFIFTGSMMAIEPHSVSLGYGVTKSAIHALVHNLVKHLEPYQHRVVGIAPGFVDTEWQKTKPVEIRKSIESKIALHRFASPEEVGDLFVTVMSNKYFNGDILTLSGGYSYR